MPSPVFDLIQDIPLNERKNKTIQLRTSTGCNGSCSFCYNQEGRWRKISAKRALEYLELYVKEGFRKFLIVDNNFVGNDLERVIKFARGLLELRNKYNTKIYFQFDARTDSFGKVGERFRHDVIQLLIKAGLYDLYVGVDSGNSYDLKIYGKCIMNSQNMLEQNKFFLNEIRKYENFITITPGFINFNSYSTIERIRENLDFIYDNFPSQFSPEVYWYSLNYYGGSILSKNLLLGKNKRKIEERIMYGVFKPVIKDCKVREFYEELYSLKPRLKNLYCVIATLQRNSNIDLRKIVQNLHEINYKFIFQLLKLVEYNASREDKEKLKQEYVDSFINQVEPYISNLGVLKLKK